MEIFERRFLYSVHVPFEDVDMGGVLYHPNYLNYLERARSHLLKSLGITFKSLLEEKIAFVVSEIHSVYKKPCYLDDELHILTQITGLKRSSLRVVQHIVKDINSETLQSLNDKDLSTSSNLHHTTKMRLVTVDLTTNKPIEFPGALKKALKLPLDGCSAPFNSTELF